MRNRIYEVLFRFIDSTYFSRIGVPRKLNLVFDTRKGSVTIVFWCVLCSVTSG